jgi:hypothetical protein
VASLSAGQHQEPDDHPEREVRDESGAAAEGSCRRVAHAETVAEAAVGKAGIKMLFPIVIFILPVLFVITLVPGMLSVLKDLKLLGAGR